MMTVPDEARSGLDGDTRSPYMQLRERLLGPEWATRVLGFREVRAAARGLSGDPGDLRIFGMETWLWSLLGIRIMGRTAVEVTRDPQARFLGGALAQTMAGLGCQISDVIDPFVGSGNLLYHMASGVGADRAVGLDADAHIIDLSRRNLGRLKLARRSFATHVEFACRDWSTFPEYQRDVPTVIVVAPPWAAGFTDKGLDLRRTVPPVSEVLDRIRLDLGRAPIFAFVHTHPQMVEESTTHLRERFEALPTHKSADRAVAERADYLLFRVR